MDSNRMKKRNNVAFVDPDIQKEASQYSFQTRLAFLPDATIGQSWFFRLLTLCYFYMYKYFHAFEMTGKENLDHNSGCLLIARHSTHNAEILGTIVAMYHETGRVTRSLIHRYLTPFFPVLRLMGAVPGERKSALSLLKSKFWVAVIPGGADEGLIGHENAYKVSWLPKRKGFAQIATEAKVPIIPIFLDNVEEMRWNPILFLWNLLGLGRFFSKVLTLEIPVLSPIIILLASTIWFIATFVQIPIPVKLTLHIGKPVQYDMSKDSIDDVVERSRAELQALIDRYHRNGKSYRLALKQRFQPLNKFFEQRISNRLIWS